MAGVVSTGIVALDQSTKWLAESALQGTAQPIAVTAFFNLVRHHNRGVSFGFLSTQHPLMPYAIVFVAAALTVLLGLWLWRTSSSLQAVGLTFIFGGAISNLLDRMRDGAVTDFLDFYIGTYHWPAFNLADAAIFCGVAIMIFRSIFTTDNQIRERC